MQLELALGALAVGIETGSEDGTTIGAAGARDRADHARRAGAELIGAARTAGWRLLFVRTLALLTFLGIAVTAMTILSIHKCLRPPALTDCHGYNLDLCATRCQLGLYPIGLLHSAGLRYAYQNVLQNGVRPRAGDGTSMFVTLWEFEVKPGCEERFQKVYGPEGDWAKLFRSDANYLETHLLHDPARPAMYLTLDFWTSRQAYERFMASHAAEYERLDAAAGELTLRERRIGWYERVG
jgi:hypothetical protein